MRWVDVHIFWERRRSVWEVSGSRQLDSRGCHLASDGTSTNFIAFRDPAGQAARSQGRRPWARPSYHCLGGWPELSGRYCCVRRGAPSQRPRALGAIPTQTPAASLMRGSVSPERLRTRCEVELLDVDLILPGPTRKALAGATKWNSEQTAKRA